MTFSRQLFKPINLSLASILRLLGRAFAKHVRYVCQSPKLDLLLFLSKFKNFFENLRNFRVDQLKLVPGITQNLPFYIVQLASFLDHIE